MAFDKNKYDQNADGFFTNDAPISNNEGLNNLRSDAAKPSRGKHAASAPIETKKGKKHSKPVQWFLNLKMRFRILLGALVAFILAVLITCIVCLWDLPDCSTADDFNTIKPTEVYASDKTTLLARFQFENRVPLDSLDSITNYAIEATVATEDERFYSHPGVDLYGIARAVVNNFTGGTLEGASTITQQLVRNTVLADEMNDISIKRKVREAFLALRMESLYSKDEILLLYMNTINYGGGAYGIEAAAQRYYSKSASELTLNEAATLAGIPQSPTYNSPIYYPEHAKARRDIVLDRMVSYGTITQEEADAVKAEPIELNTSEPNLDGFVKYPYIASYVRDQLLNTYDLSTEDVFEGGMTVYTTIDVDMQDTAEETMEKEYKLINQNCDIALVATDPDTGYIRAMVGGKDFYENQWNLATQAARQAGSSFKTFTLVAALEDGISPQTSVSCSSTVSGDGWQVSNSSNHDYGTQSIAGAFAVSSNTAFMRLCLAVGPEKVAQTAKKMGITSDLQVVPTITLGVNSVTPLEMSNAYATIANGGTHYDAVIIEEAIDRKGNVVIDNTNPEGERAISEEIAYAATQVMQGVVTGGTGTSAAISTGQPVAGKTGTTENSKDSWFVGFTPSLSVSVWIGDPDNKVAVSGVNGAAVWGAFMNNWLADKPIEKFKTADSPTYTRQFSNTDLDVSGLTSTKDPSDAPSVVGLTLQEALSLLSGYQYTQTEEYSDTVAAGSVISQQVSGNTLVIVVSKGKDPTKEQSATTPDSKSGSGTDSGSESGSGSGSGSDSGSGSSSGSGSGSSSGSGTSSGSSGGNSAAKSSG